MPKGVYIRTKEAIKNLSLSHLGRTNSLETRKKISENNKGKHKYWLGKKMSVEHRNKISKGNIGKIVSHESRLKIKANHRKPWLGKSFSNEHKEKISVSHRGINNYRWKGGKETERIRKAISENNRRVLKKKSIGTYTLEQWEMMKLQYNFTCPACKISEPSIKLTIDHIIPLSKKGSNDISNIQPLCLSCNSRKKNYYIKKY